MKKLVVLLFLAQGLSFSSFACAGWDDYWDDWSFYNLLDQTNISKQEYYPFLKTESSFFYNVADQTPAGNLRLWKELLPDWSVADIEKAVYDFSSFSWANRISNIEKRAHKYLEFAQECTEAFSYRENLNTWNYSQLVSQQSIDTESLLTKANALLIEETNEQLKARYYYQLIRILHYSQRWSDAIKVFENQIEGRISKNEIYYYLLDQVAGCYYSTGNYDKAAYFFSKVFNQSIDRKQSAFVSYNFCARKGFEGREYFRGAEDEKDLLLIKSLYQFTDRISNINEFIALDANDGRVELLFMRLVSNVERVAWPRNIGVSNKTLPNIERGATSIEDLIAIADKQVRNQMVTNKDFWVLVTSYLHFVNDDLAQAKNLLEKVEAFDEQKQILSYVFQVFGWESMTRSNEIAFYSILKNNHKGKSILEPNEAWKRMLMDRVAHVYYADNQLAKAFLMHNKLEVTSHLTSGQLLSSLERFYNKEDKNNFEQALIANRFHDSDEFIDYVYNQKGIYYLYRQNPDSALICFNKMSSDIQGAIIPAQIFSNNTKEGFTFPDDKIMEDEVYKASVFSFIKSDMTLKDVATNLIQLEQLRHDNLQWKRKLANYLLGNFYFNISNTGYYRGKLYDRSNVGHYSYVGYYFEGMNTPKNDDDIINKQVGYNLSDIVYHGRKHRGMSDVARRYYEAVIAESIDNELNARCLYLMAKCDLNDFYNKGSENTYSVDAGYSHLILPESESFKQLKEKYSDTRFHEMIIRECSYFRHYSALH